MPKSIKVWTTEPETIADQLRRQAITRVYVQRLSGMTHCVYGTLPDRAADEEIVLLAFYPTHVNVAQKVM